MMDGICNKDTVKASVVTARDLKRLSGGAAEEGEVPRRSIV